MINYKHLHYFWVVAKQGGIARASERLHLTPQTISGQINLLEEQLGEELFSKSGRNLELTETGRLVLSYADEIFSLGNELEEAIHNLPSDRPLVFFQDSAFQDFELSYALSFLSLPQTVGTHLLVLTKYF